MKTSKHAQARMTQRGITKRILEMVFEFGECDSGDKIILNRKIGQKVLAEIDQFRKSIIKLMDKGGVVLVAEGDSLITTYNVESFKRSGC